MVPHSTRMMAVIHLDNPNTLFINKLSKNNIKGQNTASWDVRRLRVCAVSCCESLMSRGDKYTEYICNFFDDTNNLSIFRISFSILKKLWTPKMFLVMLMCKSSTKCNRVINCVITPENKGMKLKHLWQEFRDKQSK